MSRSEADRPGDDALSGLDFSRGPGARYHHYKAENAKAALRRQGDSVSMRALEDIEAVERLARTHDAPDQRPPAKASPGQTANTP